MAREREGYRPVLEELHSAFPGKSVLTLPEAAKFLGKDRRTLLKDKAFPAQMIGGRYAVPVTALARYIS